MKSTNYSISKAKVASFLFSAIFLLAISISCDEVKEESTPPEIPAYESMAIDFSKFSDNTKSAQADSTSLNYGSAMLTVFVWNVTLGVTLAVPVATFYESFNHEAIFLGNATWQWTYDVNVLGGKYTARMTGQIRSDDIKWEMHVSRTGINAFGEFKWFEGTSALDGKSGQWILYHSYALQEAIIQIDWNKTGDEIGAIKYSYIRISSNGDNKQLSKDSYIQYGLQDDEFDAFYNIRATTRDIEADGFNNVYIEWSTTEFNGRIKALNYFDNSDWHCWNSDGVDVVCD